MIPHAITNTGSYVDLWSQLKALQHALLRAAHGSNSLTSLDRELLLRLIEMFRGAIAEEKAPSGELKNYFGALTADECEATLDLDLRQNLKHTAEFENWMQRAKPGTDKKIQRLIEAVEKYLSDSENGLITTHIPEDEYKVLAAIISRLLLYIESRLYA